MSELDPIPFPEPRASQTGQAGRGAGGTPEPSAEPVMFSRRELDQILRIYGQKVAAGEWRDYAIDLLPDRAVFSVFRRSSEMPLYRVEKQPRLMRRQGAYSVVAASGLILKRGRDLSRVLRVLDRKPRLQLV